MSIAVHNLKSGSSITYSLPLIVGEVRASQKHSHIDVCGERDDQPLSWPVFNGHFKALVLLQPGQNNIILSHSGGDFTLVLYYEVPDTTSLFVRPVYVRCCDDDGQFQGPEGQDCSSSSAQRRISLGAKLLQTFTAEKLHEHGFGYKTFALVSDLHDEPECEVFESKLTLEQALAMCSNELWVYFAKELIASRQFEQKDQCKWLAFLSFTRYQIQDGKVPKTHSQVIESTKGHTALGGGGLALYGTGTLHTWAETLQQVTDSFTDSRKIDRTQLMDDSAYREYYWANYSTGLGASLHELGHTFDLAHTPTGVMARGFDDLYRVFLVQPPSTRSNTPADNSHSASPIPYSPKHSPIRRIKPEVDLLSDVGGSPGPCVPQCVHQSTPESHHQSTSKSLQPTDQVRLIQVEAAFKRLRGPSKHTFTQNHYDGSQIKKSVARYPDGTELVTKITSHTSGEQTLQEQLHHAPSGKTRTTMSVSMWQCNNVTAAPNTGPSSQCSNNRLSAFWEPNHTNGLNLQELRCRDGGAHWYRSSAVLLNYHKWFNLQTDTSISKLPVMERCTIQAECGIRLLELRTQPEGVVFHHWEFLHDDPPTSFTLKPRQIQKLAPEVTYIGILVEDDHGNIFKRKMQLEELLEDENISSQENG